jgi:Flp pilus assembly protein TadG
MRTLKLLAVVIVTAIIVIGGFELYSPTIAKRDARNAADSVASAAAHKLFTERDSGKGFDILSSDAKAAAISEAAADHVTLTAFSIDANQRVHVTVAKEARSLIVSRISSLKHWDEKTASSSAAPG